MKSFMFISQLFRDMRSQKLRTFLTMFGIIWGTISIVLLLAFGVGLDRQMKKNFHGMGEGLIIVWAGKTSMPFQGMNKGRQIQLREEDAFLLEREIPQIKHALPEYNQSGIGMKYQKNGYSARVRGVYPIYGEMRNVIPERSGRFVDKIDFDKKRRVAFLGYQVKEELFKDEPAEGKYLSLSGVPFQVVGVLIEKIQNSSYGGRDESTVFIPASTFSTLFGHKYINNMIIQGNDPRQNEFIKERIYQVLGKKYRFHPEDKETLWIWDMMENEKVFSSIMLGFNLFLGLVGAFTLIVGGIGVSNIMNIVVEERTKEIGLKMALGAKKRFVLSQFLFETLLITLIGGALGIAVSYGIILVFPAGGIEEYVGRPAFSLPVAVAAVSLLGLIGFVSGLAPARHAANLNPAEALRS